MLLPDSKQKEYEQNAHTPFVFRQVKPALWKAPLRCFFPFLKLRHRSQSPSSSNSAAVRWMRSSDIPSSIRISRFAFFKLPEKSRRNHRRT